MLPFFDRPNDFSMQKKAYRILGEVLKRRFIGYLPDISTYSRNQPEIAQLFDGAEDPLYQVLLKSYDEISGF